MKNMTAEREGLIERFKYNPRKSFKKQDNIQIKVPQKEIEKIAIKQLTSSRKFPRNEECEFLN